MPVMYIDLPSAYAGGDGLGNVALLRPRRLAVTLYEDGTAYAGVKIDSDGKLYIRLGTSMWIDPIDPLLHSPEWRADGASNQFWVSRTILSSGSLTTDPGTGWLACTSDRIYDVQTTESFTTKNCNILLQISTDSSGTPVIAEAKYELSVRKEPGGSPSDSSGGGTIFDSDSNTYGLRTHLR